MYNITELFSCINLCKWFFITITALILIISVFVNLFESYLPVFVARSFRYGKFASVKESKLVQSCELPKRCFRHFYSSALIYISYSFFLIIFVYAYDFEVPLWVQDLLDIAYGCNRIATVPVIHVYAAILLMFIQISRRFLDTHFISVFAVNAKINVTHYLIGMLFYIGVIITILAEAPKFAPNSINKEETKSHIVYGKFSLLDILAVFLFLYSSYRQHMCAIILANLRKKDGIVVSQNYKIPYGDWFECVSSPHSLAEILMYTALAFLLRNNSTIWYVLAWVVVNQVETSILTHNWYKKTFKNYPRTRKAIIPFIF